MDNLELYNKVRTVPKEAIKPITGGRLKGMSDINPMWRIKSLTEQFGVCGVGWYYEILEERLEPSAKDEIAAFVKINLYVKSGDEWSKGIQGTGGSMFVELESRGLHTNDECFKMALTDALSVACKALGFGADVYFEKDKSKYDKSEETTAEPKNNKPKEDMLEKKELFDKLKKGIEYTKTNVDDLLKFFTAKDLESLTNIQLSKALEIINKKMETK